MCGRFTLCSSIKEIAEVLQAANVNIKEDKAHYNIAPTQEIVAAREDGKRRELLTLRWGLVPSWAKDLAAGARMINARSETVTEKPSFREAFRHRRCLIPADGFYEWKRTDRGKQPFFFKMKDEQPFAFAGLWERWEGEGETIESCTILTTAANEILAPVHERMPVILHKEDYELWLDADERKRELLRDLLRPYSASEMTAYPVSTQVNSTRHGGAELIEELKINSA